MVLINVYKLYLSKQTFKKSIISKKGWVLGYNRMNWIGVVILIFFVNIIKDSYYYFFLCSWWNLKTNVYVRLIFGLVNTIYVHYWLKIRVKWGREWYWACNAYWFNSIYHVRNRFIFVYQKSLKLGLKTVFWQKKIFCGYVLLIHKVYLTVKKRYIKC